MCAIEVRILQSKRVYLCQILQLDISETIYYQIHQYNIEMRKQSQTIESKE
jgi:hypothetical protein